jgi:leader peptidase (prepilin peptidase) / N-methyltransferase
MRSPVAVEPAHPLLVAYAGLLGLVLGSFLNVCIVRWGAEPKQSVVRPRSRCPRCGHEIRWYENIPVLSWLALRARCSGCGLAISPLYPVVELTTGLLWVGAVLVLGATLSALQLAVAATLLLGIAVSDARAFIIPHEFSLGGTMIAIALAAALTGGAGAWSAVQGALFGAGVVLLVGEVTELILGQEAMGGGDCALMGMVGAFFGWEAVLPVVALGACVSLVLYFISALRPSPQPPASTAASEPPATLRWGKVLTLLGGGLVPIVLLGLALRAGVIPDVLLALFHAMLGAGAAYYIGFVIPERLATGSWTRVRGLIGAGAGIVIGGGDWVTLVAGVLLSGVALVLARQGDTAPSPETTEELSAGGYLPFGVGLAIAAGVLAYAGGYERVRQTFAELAPGLGLS